MSQRLCIGIHTLTPRWESVLNEIGVWFEEIDYSSSIISNYSLIILNEYPKDEHIHKLQDFIQSGGSLLETKGIHVFIPKHQIKKSFVKTLRDGSNNSSFAHIPYIDLFTRTTLHKNSDLFGGLIHFETLQNGLLGFIGCDIPKLLQSSGFSRKKFYSRLSSYPDEIVSTVSKHELMELFRSVIAHLHYQRKLPLINKWTYPTRKPVFCFRIDSDYGDKDSVTEVYKVLNAYKIKATWFLHVRAHEEWLDHFKKFKHQEIALHGYHHGTSKSTYKLTSNIKKGLDLLVSSNFEINGFCAPYGIWNMALEKVLNTFDFKYTSEFTFKYDGYPAFSYNTPNRIQIPTHPICTGSLNRLKYSVKEMKEYFEQVIEFKTARFEPIIFYHHPLQPGLEIFGEIFEKISRSDYLNLTFSEYADFWINRRDLKFEALYRDGHISVKSGDQLEIPLQISTKPDSFGLIKTTDTETQLETIPNFEYHTRYIPSEEELRNMRKNDLRLIKTSLWDWKNRNRL